MLRFNHLRWTLLSVAFAVVGCGGGGDNESASATAPTPVAPSESPAAYAPSKDADSSQQAVIPSNDPVVQNVDAPAAVAPVTPSAPVVTAPAAKPVTTKPVTAPTVTQPVANPLLVSGSPAKAATVGVAYSFKPMVTSASGATLKFEIANKPAWATFSASTGQLTGTPKAADVGVAANVVIQVSDGKNFATVPTFSITVQAVSNGSATLSWTAPTQNADGSALTTLGGYKVYWGTSADDLSSSATISNVGLVRHVVENLAPGKYFFAMTAVTRAGTESARSAVATKTII